MNEYMYKWMSESSLNKNIQVQESTIHESTKYFSDILEIPPWCKEELIFVNIIILSYQYYI